MEPPTAMRRVTGQRSEPHPDRFIVFLDKANHLKFSEKNMISKTDIIINK